MIFVLAFNSIISELVVLKSLHCEPSVNLVPSEFSAQYR